MPNQPTSKQANIQRKRPRRIFGMKTACPELSKAVIMPGLMKTGDWGFYIKPGLRCFSEGFLEKPGRPKI